MSDDVANAVWGGLLAAAAAAEAWALINRVPGDTLSERLRQWLRLDTRTGRVVFTAGWGLLSSWVLVHLLGVDPF